MKKMTCSLLIKPKNMTYYYVLWLSICISMVLIEIVWRSSLLSQIAEKQHTLYQYQRNMELQRQLSIQKRIPILDQMTLTEFKALSAELTLPWEALLDNIQQLTAADVILEQIRPDLTTKYVVLKGSATNAKAFFDFIQKIQKKSHWQVIQPVNEVVKSHTDQMIDFELMLQWSEHGF